MSFRFSARAIGRTLVRIVAVLLLLDAVLQAASPQVMMDAHAHIGFPATLQPVLPFLTLTCATLLAFRATSLIGAILTTGFLGGAIAIHVPVDGLQEPGQVVSLLLGGLTWGGMVLAESALRELLPFGGTGSPMRSAASHEPTESNLSCASMAALPKPVQAGEMAPPA